MTPQRFSKLPVVFLAAAVLLSLVWFRPRLFPDGAAALEAFEHAAQPATTGIDPLVLAGDSAVPFVLVRVTDHAMPRRSDAIRFLAEGGYREAIPVLDRMIHDETEKGFIRCEALLAVARIDETLGLNRAVQLKSRLDDLGFCTKQVLAGILPEGSRSYAQARWASFTRW